LKQSREEARESATDLQRTLWSVNLSALSLSRWTGGDGLEWFARVIPFLEERLVYAELAAQARSGPGGPPAVVMFDDVVFATIDNSSRYDDLRAALKALQAGDVTKLDEILGKYIVVSPDFPDPYFDPVFAKMFANQADPSLVADMLISVDKLRGYGSVKDWYAGFLDDLAGMLSTGTKTMTPAELDRFARV